MAKAKGGQGTPATVAAAKAGIGFTVHAYTIARDTANYGQAVADALGVAHDRLFKTLMTDVDGTLTVAVVPVSSTLDLKGLAAAVGGRKARMADPAVAERVTGYVVGGISPLGQRRRLPTVIDSSATTLSTMFVSAGRRGSQIELAPADLITLTSATTAVIARDS